MSYADIATACLRRLPPETAHDAALTLLGRVPLPQPPPPAPALAQTLWGLRFSTPTGLAAGFDKDARCPDAAARLGLGFGEAGTVTPRPQPGNPRPRLFRLRRERALINRYGFNSAGLEVVADRLERWRSAHSAPARPLGINIGVNTDSTDPARDYAAGFARVASLADYVAVNVSSPNTPGLRAWQAGDALRRLLTALADAHARLDSAPPILLKLAPDIDDEGLAALLEAIRQAPIAGLILTNTTTARPAGLVSRHRKEEGGLSGPPLAPRALAVLRLAYALSDGRLPLIGVGGIDSAEAGYARIRAGASLVQLYTALVYRGPRLVGEITLGLARLLAADGFASLAEAVGADHRAPGECAHEASATSRTIARAAASGSGARVMGRPT
ncbi:MAG: quinone-dependent dihydroorotate dehydrogenase, partial [Rhodospirillales bacterium]|nr:quinone-dependent dihydroorotate dehydrogenase [Rhodospirillales bacterium]